MRNKNLRRANSCGFSFIELTMTLLVVVILAGIAIPYFAGEIHTSQMRGLVSDFASLTESQRLYAIRDNRFYSTYILAASGSNPPQAYVDMFPKSSTGASGNGGTAVVAGTPGVSGDPVIEIPGEVTQQAQGNAPSTTNL